MKSLKDDQKVTSDSPQLTEPGANKLMVASSVGGSAASCVWTYPPLLAVFYRLHL